MIISVTHDKREVSAKGLVRANISRFLDEASKIVEKNIKAELRSKNKTGEYVGPYSTVNGVRYKRFSNQRSAKLESLARETGRSESLISSEKIGSTGVKIGFLEDQKEGNYVAFHEEENDRPTMQLAIDKSLKEIESIMDKNFRPK